MDLSKLSEMLGFDVTDILNCNCQLMAVFLMVVLVIVFATRLAFGSSESGEKKQSPRSKQKRTRKLD